MQTGIQIHLANKSGHLAGYGNSQHRIYWEEYGSVNGEPVMFMHGGPGAGCHSSSARFFNPERYRVILLSARIASDRGVARDSERGSTVLRVSKAK